MHIGGTARVAALLVVGSLALGVVGAGAVDGFLAVSFRDKDPLTAPERPGAAPLVPVAAPERVALTLPAPGDPLVDLAGEHVVASLEAAGADVSAGTDGTGTAAGTPAAAATPTASLVAELVPAGPTPDAGTGTDADADADPDTPDPQPETYELSRDGDAVRLTAADRRGLAAGLFQLADHLDGGRGWADVEAGPTTVAPALGRRLVDTGAVGITPDPQAYAAQDDYVHANGALADVVLAQEPWLDPDALSDVDQQWRTYVDRMVSYGYDGVVVPGFLEYVTFAGVEDGDAVYPPGSPYRERAEAMREQVGDMWAYADTMGMDVVMVTDMLALTEPLEAYLQQQPGGLDADSEQLWQVYRAAADELLTELPFVDGLMIRVGEAGAIYNLDGWDYYSALEVTEDQQVRTMLATFTDVAAEHDADVYLRSWTVGVGEVGDLHTSPDTYERVLGDLGPAQGMDDLVVSTKFVAGDFDAWLPLNPTLLAGPQQRIVEIQARREFEGFSAFPNDTTGDHAAALQQVRAANPALDGVWVWTQSGGPQRAGPMSLYLTTGFWQLYDLQVWTSARLAWDPDADLEAMERTWLRRTWSQDPQTVAGLSDLLAASRQAVLDGLYVEPYAEQEVRAFGLEPPPMLWVFKWDLVGGDTATWSALYEADRGRVDEAVAGGEDAVAQVEAMQATLAGIDPATFTDPGQHALLTRSLAYERDLFLTLGSYREVMLRGYEWLDTGDAASREAHLAAAATYAERVEEHRTTWSGDLDFPPYEFAAADAGLDRLEGRTASRLLAGGMLVVAVLGLALVPLLRRAALRPWRSTPARWHDAGPGARALSVVVPLVVLTGAHAAFGSMISPLYLSLAVTTALATVLGALVVQRGVRGSRRVPWGAVAASVAGPQLVGVLPLLVATAWRGPTGAWLGFWTTPPARGVYVVAAVAALLWVLLAPALSGASGPGRPGRLTAVATAAAAAGTALLWLGGLLALVGTERLLTLLNDEMQVVPGGLSRILGLTVHLGVPATLGTSLLLAAAVAWSVALLLLAGAYRSGRPVRPPSGPAAQPSAVSASSSHSAST
ncbi:hypothetical protein [Aquipuribacter sp. MA13-6]|uniref:hypothetical protein n=1 Tax=unclassified Aquipuribacter TaxID=2635084 RepID=UPI003EEC9A69